MAFLKGKREGGMGSTEKIRDNKDVKKREKKDKKLDKEARIWRDRELRGIE